MSNVIFYFTGTGNSLYAAKKISEKLSGETSLIPIAAYAEKGFAVSSADYVGIVFPVYAWGPPLIVKSFIKNLNVEQCQYFFITLTFGGSSGNAAGITEKMLKKRNISCNGIFEVIMPSNYIVLYNAPDSDKSKKVLKKAKKNILRAAEAIRRKKEVFVRKNFFSRILSAAAYSFFGMGAKKMGRNFKVTDACNGCGICQDICPVENIQLDGDRKPGWLDHCEQCVACIHCCPEEAIQYKSRTKERNRYHHPEITVEDMKKQKNGI
ncbi:MAG: EFR1 family ferrodoxin [bacterium]